MQLGTTNVALFDRTLIVFSAFNGAVNMSIQKQQEQISARQQQFVREMMEEFTPPNSQEEDFTEEEDDIKIFKDF